MVGTDGGLQQPSGPPGAKAPGSLDVAFAQQLALGWPGQLRQAQRRALGTY